MNKTKLILRICESGHKVYYINFGTTYNKKLSVAQFNELIQFNIPIDIVDGRIRKRKNMLLKELQVRNIFKKAQAKIELEKKVKPIKIKIDLLDGLTSRQKEVVKYLVEERGVSPMSITVNVDTNEIYVMGKKVM